MSDTARAVPSELGQARERFLELVQEIRPELHRYCARLVGSVVNGEDIVQETLAKAFYHLSLAAEVPPLRPWLFRIAHNTAVDSLRKYEQKHVEARADFDDTAAPLDTVDPDIVRAALSSFLTLPVSQRSAVILKDVLGHSLEEAADTMGTTVPAVKAALVRGRAGLRGSLERPAEKPSRPTGMEHGEREKLQHYASLFNARNWEGLRSLISDECRLDLVSRAARRGKEIHHYFARYSANTEARLGLGTVEGKPALLYFDTQDAVAPAYFIFFEWAGDSPVLIRDFRYVPYIAAEAELTVEPAAAA